MSAAERIAAAGRRVADSLARRGRAPVVTLEHEPDFPPNVGRALQGTHFQERASGGDQHRVVVLIPGCAPFLAGDAAATEAALKSIFPALKTKAQTQVARSFIEQAYRQRQRTRRRANSWTRNW